MFYPQGNFNSQGNLGYPQGGFGQQSFQATPNAIPFANTLYGYPQPLYGYPQLTPHFAQTPPHVSNWQQLAQQQAALQQQAILQLLAPQLAGQSPASQHPSGIGGLSGVANGAGQSGAVWQQPQASPEQINPALVQQSQHQFQQPQYQLLQRLAQYHYLVAQQLAQLAAQQAAQGSGNPYTGPYAGQFVPGTGQFIPNQLGANFVPGITMH